MKEMQTNSDIQNDISVGSYCCTFHWIKQEVSEVVFVHFWGRIRVVTAIKCGFIKEFYSGKFPLVPFHVKFFFFQINECLEERFVVSQFCRYATRVILQ